MVGGGLGLGVSSPSPDVFGVDGGLGLGVSSPSPDVSGVSGGLGLGVSSSSPDVSGVGDVVSPGREWSVVGVYSSRLPLSTASIV